MFSDTIHEYKNELPSNTYHKYCKNIYSQNGEDGILEKLLEELDIKQGECCEFGASDGKFSSNTYRLIERGFKSLLIESDITLYNKLVATMNTFSNVTCVNAYVNPQNLSVFLANANFSKQFDVLSIDIDSYDYQVWKDFNDFVPKIVIIEVNSYRDPIVEEIHHEPTLAYGPNDPLVKICPTRVAVGSSFMSVLKLGISKNYTPVAFTGNITFVHNDYLSMLKDFPYIKSTEPKAYLPLYTNLVLWKNTWYTNDILCFNTAIRNYFLYHNELMFDFTWVVNDMNTKKYKIWDTNT